ncbi:hypothetical protein [Bdellovibrio reynosensis]|uniref:Uncharacterized protein n=1 Tax=Bdellovibrio reynosensis TaxID=2835041 RepID=A0ABY4C5D6_9BACT|nr:hypothetical protein [Bdellovibrio reynosensis]UOF00034.1 hypothetical protein MNR06_10005 [Bdellovibrio reynosensis]
MKFFVPFLLLLVCATGWGAQVDLRTTKRIIIPEDKFTPKITTADVAKVVPTDLKAGASQETVISRIADRGISLWFNSAAMRATTLGRIAETTQEKLKTDVELPAASEEGVSHKFSFKIEAFQAMAKLEYTGWLKAAINYDAKIAETDISIKEKIFANKDLTLSHKGNSKQALSMIGVAWTF